MHLKKRKTPNSYGLLTQPQLETLLAVTYYKGYWCPVDELPLLRAKYVLRDWERCKYLVRGCRTAAQALNRLGYLTRRPYRPAKPGRVEQPMAYQLSPKGERLMTMLRAFGRLHRKVKPNYAVHGYGGEPE